MKIIRISTDLELTAHEFPSVGYAGYAEEDLFFRNLIGNHCRTYEHIMPDRLYSDLHMCNHPLNTPGVCVSMLVDEEGRLKKNERNAIGCYLYKTDKHRHPIMGNILLVGEVWDNDEIEFCGIHDTIFKRLEQKLNRLISIMKSKKDGFYL